MGEILTKRVSLLEQASPADPGPTLDLLLPGDRVANVRKLFEVVNPGFTPRLCSSTRRAKSLVTPVYKTPPFLLPFSCPKDARRCHPERARARTGGPAQLSAVDGSI